MCPTNINELMDCVSVSYLAQPIETTENVFLTLQKVMECVMMEKGGNKYSLPHMGKATIRKINGELPLTISCSEEAVNSAAEFML